MLFVQISDLHVGRSSQVEQSDQYALLEAAIRQINTISPSVDLVLMTGDLLSTGHREEAKRLRGVLNGLVAPYRLVAGNHDCRLAFRHAFSDHAYLFAGEHVQYEIDEFELRIIVLDSKGEGCVGGEICSKRLAWLSRLLHRHAGHPILIAMHHPPFITRLSEFDAHGFIGLEDLRSVLVEHDNIVAVLAGHLHRAVTTRLGHIPIITAPSGAFAYSVEFDPVEKVPRTNEAPGFLLHSWSRNSGLITYMIGIMPT